MAKSKRPEQKFMYDVMGLFFILYLLKEMAKVWAPSWKEGVFYITVGCYVCIGILGVILCYLYLFMDGTARKLRELFYFYKFEGNNGYPRFLGKKKADYFWLYGIVSPEDERNTLKEFWENNKQSVQYRYSLPTGLAVKELSGKLEGIVQHLNREVIIFYEDDKLNIVVGDITNRRFIHML